MYDRMGRDGRDPSRRAWPAWTIAAIAIATLSAVVVAHWLGTATPTATRALATAPGGDDDAEVSDASPLIEDGLHHLPKIWSFALDRHALGILDVDPGGGLPAALLAAQAEVVVNAGFFGPNGEPVGLVVTNGKTSSALDASLSGGVLTSDGARARLFATEGFVLPSGTSFALQCRPRLVVDGVAHVKRDDGQRAERTALCVRDGGRRIELSGGVGPS